MLFAQEGILRISPSNFNDLFLEEFIEKTGGTIFHEKALNQFISKYYKTQFYYLANNVASPEIISPLHIQKQSFRKQYILKPLYDIPYGGFIGTKQIDFTRVKLNFFESFVYSGIPLTKNYQYNFKPEVKNVKFLETAMIDLSHPLDSIFDNVINSKRRNMIRKGQNSNLRIEKFDSIKGLEFLYPLIESLHIKLGYPHLEKFFYYDLLDYYLSIRRAAIFVSFRNNVAISGIIVLGNKNYIHYYKGASSRDKLNEGQGELLQWEAIKWAKEFGSKFYDLCGLDRINLPQLYTFKTGFSKNLFYFPVYFSSKTGYKIINRINKFIR